MAAKRALKRGALRSRQKMWMPRKTPSQVLLKPLGKNEYRSKLYGLMALKELRKTTGLKVLGFKVCDNPASFSINMFSNPSQGRFIIRSDPITKGHVQTMKEWVEMPRLNFYLNDKQPKKSEALIRAWMKKKQAANPNIRFIIHKVKNLTHYDRSVQLNIDLETGAVKISTTMAATDRFREERVGISKLIIDEKKRLRREIGEKIVLPEMLQARTLSIIKRMISYAKRTGHQVFEASYVTYKSQPNEPEFYDLIFGKEF